MIKWWTEWRWWVRDQRNQLEEKLHRDIDNMITLQYPNIRASDIIDHIRKHDRNNR